MAQAVQPRTGSPAPPKPAPSPPRAKRKVPFLIELYRSALGKKYVMALTGIVFMLYVLLHMVGNLKMFYGPEELNEYSHFLRNILYPILPHSGFLWLFRLLLIVSLVLHVHAAYALTVMNRRARPTKYQAPRHYVAANFASRSMRWTGVIVLLFVAWHLADLTWGWANPDFVYGDVYHNVVSSLEQVPVAIFYIVANLALGVHLYHGAWSIFQSLGFNNPRFNPWRRWFAIAFTAVVVIGNVSFPVAVQLGVVSE